MRFALLAFALLACGPLPSERVSLLRKDKSDIVRRRRMGGPVLAGSGTRLPGDWNAGDYALVNGVPVSLPSDVTHVDIIGSNDTWVGTPTDATDPIVSNVAIGPNDGSDRWIDETPDAVFLGRTFPADGTVDEILNVPITLGVNRQVLLVHTVPGLEIPGPGDPTKRIAISALYYGHHAVNTQTVNPLPAWDAVSNNLRAWVRLRYHTSKRRIIILGDSPSNGTNACTIEQTWPYLLALNHDIAVDPFCGGSLTLGGWGADVNQMLWNEPNWAGADVLIAATKVGDATLAQRTADFTATVAHAKALGARRIYATLGPHYEYLEVADNILIEWNATLADEWQARGLAAPPADLAAVLDAEGDPYNLNGDYSPDNRHYNAAGQLVALAPIEEMLGL